MLTVANVSYRYDTEPVLVDIDLEVHQGEIVCLLGQSGSGKTTLLRVIAGLEMGYSGQVTVSGDDMATMPIHQRGFGLMFQDFALFPHMTVADNVAYGLRMQGKSKSERQKIVDEMLALVGLEGYQDRDVSALSGGQKQRVALARSLAPQPRLLMLDEPLGSLDASLQESLVVELRDIIKEIGITAIYVTHNQQEALAIADRIAIMNNGHIVQYDTPVNLYHSPKTPFVAEFLGLTNIVPASFIREYINQDVSAQQVLIHPNSITLVRTSPLNAKIIERVFQGDRYRLRVKIADVTLTLYTSTSANVPQTDETVFLGISEEGIHIFTDN